MTTVIDHATTKRNISANLRRLLSERGMSQADLARETRDNAAYISRLCSGKLEPTASGAARVAAALSVTVEDLLSDPPEKFRHSA